MKTNSSYYHDFYFAKIFSSLTLTITQKSYKIKDLSYDKENFYITFTDSNEILGYRTFISYNSLSKLFNTPNIIILSSDIINLLQIKEIFSLSKIKTQHISYKKSLLPQNTYSQILNNIISNLKN